MSFLDYIGRFHPALVHIPIGILLAVALLECMALKPKFRSLLPAVKVLLVVGFIAACVAATTGYLHSLAESFDEDLVDTHLWFAIAVAVVSLVTVSLERRRDQMLHGYYSSLATLTILIVAAGHTGANITYGVEYLSPVNVLQPKVDPLTNISSEALVYGDLVKPVLEKKCVGCHGPSRQKGKLRLDSPEFIQQGGEDGAILNSERPEESELWNRISLDISNDDHMPPSEKPQLSKAELSLILYWLSTGSDFKGKLGSLSRSDSIVSLLADLSGQKTEVIDEAIAMPDERVLDEFRAGGVAVSFLSGNDGRLALQFINADSAKLLTLMDKLGLLREQLVEIKFPRKKISSQGWQKLKGLGNLRKLSVEHSDFSDADIDVIATLSKLEQLNLVGTGVTAAGLSKITLPSLRYLYLFKTGVVVADVPALKQHFPSAEINLGNFQVPTLGSDTTERKDKYVVPD